MNAMTLDIYDVQTRLLELLSFINAGTEIIITQAQKPIMRLSPLEQLEKAESRQERIPGLHQGMGWISDDFDEPLPDEFWLGAE